MFEWFSSENDAIGLLKQDHDKVKDLFDQFEKAKSRAAKDKIVGEALTELKIHAVLEEELFYPAVRKFVGRDLMNEADEEHHVAKILIAELEYESSKDDHYDAKFKVLSENIEHHIKEEEHDLMSKARGAKVDFEKLGLQMQERRRELLEKGIPHASEEKMVSATHGRADSPAAAAHKSK